MTRDFEIGQTAYTRAVRYTVSNQLDEVLYEGIDPAEAFATAEERAGQKLSNYQKEVLMETVPTHLTLGSVQIAVVTE
jgi:hypothetical protein